MKIGTDIGGSHISVGLINEKNEIIKKTDQDLHIKENMPDYILQYLKEQISLLAGNEKIDVIGISVPGNVQGNVAKNMYNLKIDCLDFKTLQETFNTQINVINDAKAASLAEKEMGALKQYSDCIYLCLGTGIGSAVFLNDRLLKANKNNGFELGHMIIDKNGPECNCGKRGCFEACCSFLKFKKKAQQILDKYGKAENVTDAKSLKIELEKNLDLLEIQKLIESYINDLIIGLSNLIDIFEPEAICFGGSFVFFKNIFYDKLVNEMEKRKYVFNKQSPLPKIVLAKFENYSGMIGSTIY